MVDINIEELFRGKSVEEVNDFKDNIRQLRDYMRHIKEQTKTPGIFLVTKNRDIIYSVFDDPQLFNDIHEAILRSDEFHGGFESVKGELRSLFAEKISLFRSYIPFQETIKKSSKAIHLVTVQGKQRLLLADYELHKLYELYEEIRILMNIIVFKVFFVLNEKRGVKGYLIEKEKEYPKKIKYDLDALLDHVIKILKGEYDKIS